jgi:hypothetical protein
MTGGAGFGDFLLAARRDLDARGMAGRGSAEEASRGLARVVAVMSRYVRDMTAVYGGMAAEREPALGTWARASVEARTALANAAGFLREHGNEGRMPRAPAASPLGRRLDAISVSLTAGRDLLHTHFAPIPGGAREPRSEWAAVVSSATVRRTLLAELGPLARQIAGQCADVALAPSPGTPPNADARRRLNAACQWLWVFDASVRQAQHREPVTTEERDLLAAIPANALSPRRVPAGEETVSELIEGTLACAERIRRLAWRSAQEPPWSLSMTVTSMRTAAEASTVTSHNCHLALQALAARAGHTGYGSEVSADLQAAAEAAAGSRQVWLQAVRSGRQISTETRGYLSPAAAEATDLALWTGRLAYAGPGWTPASGPNHPPRPPEELAAAPEDLRSTVAAIHQTCETLNQLACAERDRVRAAATAGRILVPTRSLPSRIDLPRPFAPASRERVIHLVNGYTSAVQATGQAVGELGRIAVATKAPSRVLATARAAIGTAHASRAGRQDDEHGHEAGWDRKEREELRDLAGPVERTLLGLGIDRPDLLARGAKLDRAAERLLIDAANLEPARRRPAATALSQTADTAALVNHALASSDPRAAALLRRSVPIQAEQPEPEP